MTKFIEKLWNFVENAIKWYNAMQIHIIIEKNMRAKIIIFDYS